MVILTWVFGGRRILERRDLTGVKALQGVKGLRLIFLVKEQRKGFPYMGNQKVLNCLFNRRGFFLRGGFLPKRRRGPFFVFLKQGGAGLET